METEPGQALAEAWEAVRLREKARMESAWADVVDSGEAARDAALESVNSTVDTAKRNLDDAWKAAVENGARAMDGQPQRALEATKASLEASWQFATDAARWKAALDAAWKGTGDAWNVTRFGQGEHGVGAAASRWVGIGLAAGVTRLSTAGKRSAFGRFNAALERGAAAFETASDESERRKALEDMWAAAEAPGGVLQAWLEPIAVRLPSRAEPNRTGLQNPWDAAAAEATLALEVVWGLTKDPTLRAALVAQERERLTAAWQEVAQSAWGSQLLVAWDAAAAEAQRSLEAAWEPLNTVEKRSAALSKQRDNLRVAWRAALSATSKWLVSAWAWARVDGQRWLRERWEIASQAALRALSSSWSDLRTRGRGRLEQAWRDAVGRLSFPSKPERAGESGLSRESGLSGKPTARDGRCVDYTGEGYFKAKGKALTRGLPSSDFVHRPAQLSVCELEQLHSDCVARINKYRAGALKFKDGSDDDKVKTGLKPLVEATAGNRCSSQQALGDLHYNVRNGGGCAGGHHTAFTCPWTRSTGQNSCCARGAGAFGVWDRNRYETYSQVRDALYECLQMMWDEGVTPGQKGHWETMRSPDFTYAHCGFAWSAQGRVFMNQDFSQGDPGQRRSAVEGTRVAAGLASPASSPASASSALPSSQDIGMLGLGSALRAGSGLLSVMVILSIMRAHRRRTPASNL